MDGPAFAGWRMIARSFFGRQSGGAGTNVRLIGLDIAKNVFQDHGIDATGHPALRRNLRRAEVLPLFSKLEPALVGIEACHTAPHWAREIAALGHAVRLMPPQFVKPYVKSQKN